MRNSIEYWCAPSRSLLVLCIAVFVAYLPLFSNDFVDIDDDILITNNSIVTQLSADSIGRAFRSYDPELYIPLTLLTFQLEYALFGPNPIVFHTINLLLHLLASVLIFFLIRRLLDCNITAIITALLFALHPVQVEAVAWASARKDVLSGVLGLACLYLFVLYRSTDNRRFYFGSILTFVLALLSKVTVVCIPFVLLLLDWFRKKSFLQSLRDSGSFFVASLVFGIIALVGKTENVGSVSPIDYILLAAKNVGFSLQHFLVPLRFSVIYPQQLPVEVSMLSFLIPFIITIVFIALTVAAFVYRKRLIVLCGVSFLLLLSPAFLTVWKNGFVFFTSDRYVYLAALFLFLLCSIAMTHLYKRYHIATLFLVGVVMLSLTTLTFRQVRVWQNTETLFRHALRIYPHSAFASNNVGAVLLDNDDFAEAEALLLRAASLDPTYAKPLRNLFALHLSQGNIEQAEQFLVQAVAVVDNKDYVSIDDIQLYYIQGQRFDDAHKQEQALALFKRAAERLPTHAQPHFNLGVMYHKYGRFTEAIESLQRAVNITPRVAEVHYQLGAVYRKLDRIQDAIASFQTVLTIDPSHRNALAQLKQLRQRR